MSYAYSRQSPLGLLMMAATDRGLCFASVGTSGVRVQQRLRMSLVPRFLRCANARAALRAMGLQLVGPPSRAQTSLSLPWLCGGTASSSRSGTTLPEIPYGEVRSFEVARAIRKAGTASRGGQVPARGTRRASVAIAYRVIRRTGALAAIAGGH